MLASTQPQTDDHEVTHNLEVDEVLQAGSTEPKDHDTLAQGHALGSASIHPTSPSQMAEPVFAEVSLFYTLLFVSFSGSLTMRC